MAARQLGELVGQRDAAVRILGRDKVERHLDARREIAHLGADTHARGPACTPT